MMNYISGQQLLIVHKTDKDNTRGNLTLIDCPSLNNKPDAFLTITKRYDGTYNTHPIGVYYDKNKKKWGIFNQDRKKMKLGLVFNVTAACFVVLHASMDPLPGAGLRPDHNKKGSRKSVKRVAKV